MNCTSRYICVCVYVCVRAFVSIIVKTLQSFLHEFQNFQENKCSEHFKFKFNLNIFCIGEEDDEKGGREKDTLLITNSSDQNCVKNIYIRIYIINCIH